MYNTHSNRADALRIIVSNIIALEKYRPSYLGDREYDKMREGLKQTFISSFTKNAITR